MKCFSPGQACNLQASNRDDGPKWAQVEPPFFGVGLLQKRC